MNLQPGIVESTGGEKIVLNGSVLNFGYYWLHDFNVTLYGLPEDFKYTVDPAHWDDLKLIRGWNEIDGTFFIPENFKITIDIPEGASGAYNVKVVGQEFQSWKQVSNSTDFILKVSSTPSLSVSDIVVPERVVQNEPFTVSMTVRNDGKSDQLVNVSTLVPETWRVDPQEKAIIVAAGNATSISFSVTPSSEVGTISVVVKYPIRETILNITKVGTQIVPQSPSPIIIPTDLTGFQKSFQFLSDNPIIVVIIVVIIILTIMYFSQSYDFRRSRKKPEEMKRQADAPETKI